jgi:hypothetical protein
MAQSTARALLHQGTDSGLRVRTALSFGERLVGLIGRSELADKEGLWIQPCDRVHTCAMRFAIDLIMLDRHGCIVALAETLRPWRLGPRGQSRGVALELATGSIARLRLCVGDQLTLGDP